MNAKDTTTEQRTQSLRLLGAILLIAGIGFVVMTMISIAGLSVYNEIMAITSSGQATGAGLLAVGCLVSGAILIKD